MSTNVHDYDGRLNRKLEVPILSLRQCIIEITFQTSDPLVISAISLIASGQGNHDQANQLDADILLRLTWEKVRGTDLQPLYFEQLVDIVVSGSCPQGRTSRLLQFL
jgi:hypothetical protein